MTGTTITPPFWGVVLGFAVVIACLCYGAWKEEQRKVEEREALEAEVLAGLPQRTRRITDDEIDHTYAAGE